MDQAPSQGIIPLVPCCETGCPGNAGDTSPARQSGTDGQCVFPLPVPEQIVHRTTLVLHCLGGRQDHPAGQVRPMAQVFREAAAPAFGTGSWKSFRCLQNTSSIRFAGHRNQTHSLAVDGRGNGIINHPLGKITRSQSMFYWFLHFWM